MSSAPKPASPREAYIQSLGAVQPHKSVLLQSEKDRNRRAALGGIAPYIPPNPDVSPEN